MEIQNMFKFSRLFLMSAAAMSVSITGYAQEATPPAAAPPQAQPLGQTASDCSAYPGDGIEVTSTPAGTKIISTGEASVAFDDVDAVRDAREEATIEAKSKISAFLSEGIRSDSEVNRVVNGSTSMQGTEKTALRTETVNRLRKIASSSQALLRGVVVLGDCYTQGKVLRVSVGLKPETIAAAEGMAGGMSSSLTRQPTPGTAQGNTQPSVSGNQAPKSVAPGGTGQPLNAVPSYSNTKGLQGF